MSNTPILIVKVGTGVLTKDDGSLNSSLISSLTKHLSAIKKSGTPVALVSSGAVGAGVPLLGLSEYPQEICTRQAAAAVGQAHLMRTYQDSFNQHGITTAQILLSSHDLRQETHKNRAKEVLIRLLEHENILPIINENDVVSLRELTKTDNDMLAANLSVILCARTLILLTSVDGLLDENHAVVPQVESIPEARMLVTGDSGKFSIGGMHSKLDAVERAMHHGTQVIIGNGTLPERLPGYLDHTSIGTYFI